MKNLPGLDDRAIKLPTVVFPYVLFKYAPLLILLLDNPLFAMPRVLVVNGIPNLFFAELLGLADAL